ncbi:MAG: glycosyltransferase, partial [Actinomycetes bacterium]
MGNTPAGAAAATSRVASSQCSAPRVSVVVPARNEAVLLPRLLESLAKQTRPPDEVVVADALSVDETVEVARELGALVVRGGPPAVGRNAGACATTGELLLFLDADVVPGPGFVADAVGEFTRRRLDVATAPIAPVEQAWDFRVAYRIIGLWLRAVSRISPHAVGACILVRRDLHDRLGGFDETLALAEDHD